MRLVRPDRNAEASPGPRRLPKWLGHPLVHAAALCALLPSVAAVTALPAAAARGRTFVFGHSVQGRPLVARVLGSSSAARKIVLVGCIHGDECAGRAILSAAEQAPAPANVQLWLVPTLNPDGEAAGTRQNAHGVDLNRNFPYRWRPVPGPTYYSGPHPRSEPETRAAMRLIARVRPYATVVYHQHEDLVDMPGGDRGLARRYAELAGLRATCLPFLPGTESAWSNHTLPGTTSFVVELPTGPVRGAALRRHLRALGALEHGARSGSARSCAP
jgi:murein peptide amidase A